VGECCFKGGVLELVVESLEFLGDHFGAGEDGFLRHFGAECEFCGEGWHGEDGGAVE